MNDISSITATQDIKSNVTIFKDKCSEQKNVSRQHAFTRVIKDFEVAFWRLCTRAKTEFKTMIQIGRAHV